MNNPLSPQHNPENYVPDDLIERTIEDIGSGMEVLPNGEIISLAAAYENNDGFQQKSAYLPELSELDLSDFKAQFGIDIDRVIENLQDEVQEYYEALQLYEQTEYVFDHAIDTKGKTEAKQKLIKYQEIIEHYETMFVVLRHHTYSTKYLAIIPEV